MAKHKKYRCADYHQFDTLKEARQHASELSRGVDQENRHITSLIYVCVDCRAFYPVYLPYETKREGKTEKLYMARTNPPKQPKRTAEIIPFPKPRTTRTNPGLIERKEMRQHFYRIRENGDVRHDMMTRRSDNYILLDIEGAEWTPIEDYGDYVASDTAIENPFETWFEMIEAEKRRAA